MNYLNIEEFEKKLGYHFVDKTVLMLALTHSSYANEHKKGNHENNERLEFLGDAVLDMVVSEYIYRKFPELPEGELTKLRAAVVCEGALAELSKKLGVGRNLFLGKGEESTGGRTRESILADAFEAIIGAVCIDGGIEAASAYVMRIMKDKITKTKPGLHHLDSKTHLQEVVQKFSKIPLQYEIIDEKGPDHNKVFMAQVSHDGKVWGTGSGRSKKEAEQNAANAALEQWYETNS